MTDKPTPGRSWTSVLGPKKPQATPEPQPAGAAAAPVATTELPTEGEELPDREYKAFRTSPNRNAKMLEIRYFEPRVGVEEGDLLSMPLFVQAHYVGHEHVILQFQNAVFQIEGRGVRQLVTLLKQGSLHTIQQWNERHWQEPPHDQPKITRIIAMTPEQASGPEQEGRPRERSEERVR